MYEVFPFAVGKRVWDSLLRWKKGSETPSFPRWEHEERGSLRPLFPTARGSLRPFFPLQKGKPRTSPKPLSANPLSATHETGGRCDENGENDEFSFYPLKTRASLLRTPKTTKMTKMASVTQAKARFRKSRVCSSLTEELISITETDLWECLQKISDCDADCHLKSNIHYRYRLRAGNFGPVPKAKQRSFALLGGNEEDWRGTIKAKIAPILVHFFGGHFYFKAGLGMRFLAKMLAADQSNATLS